MSSIDKKLKSNIRFITDENGHKTSVIMTLEDYRTLIEDYQDLARIVSRQNDEFLPLEDALTLLDD